MEAEGLNGRERLQVDGQHCHGRRRRRGKLLEMLLHVVLSASGVRHQHTEFVDVKKL